MIEIKNLSCGYNGKEIVHNVDLCFEKSDVNIILGPNGCGKSTLMKAMVGVLNVKDSMICIDGKDINKYKDVERAKKIAFMPQIRNVPSMSVFDFMMCARYPYLGLSKVPEKVDVEAVENAIKVCGISEYSTSSIKKLSGGERQKVYFAFMLAQQTDILMLDEPTTYLDVKREFEILDMIKNMKKDEKTIVIILHDICHALKYADKIVVMDKGKIEAFGTPEQILESGVLEKIYNIKLHKIEFEGDTEYIIKK